MNEDMLTRLTSLNATCGGREREGELAPFHNPFWLHGRMSIPIREFVEFIAPPRQLARSNHLQVQCSLCRN